jgi:LuxR family maltose regulon positive regulatory protein
MHDDAEVNFALGKIRPPTPRGATLLPRPALEARLREVLAGHRAVVVAAPAGCGKTALLVRALHPPPPGQALAWVSLDPGDDLHRLLECLLAALEPLDLPWRSAPEGLMATALAGDPRGRQQAADDLVNALDAADVAHGAIVIDDLHHLADEAAHHVLARLLERLGPRWTLVLASREAPPAALLARAAAAGELARFGQDELAFSAAEVQDWFAQMGLDAAAAASLHARTAGWAAGLKLAASGARGAGPGSAIDRAAFEFLATEVLAHLDADLRAFLLDTSVLHVLDAARCEALTGDARAARWLDEIERRGLFASVVDDAGTTLRLHDLFRDALQHRLRIERPEDWPALLVRAAELEPDPLRKQALLLAARRPDHAARALLAAAPALNLTGASATVLRMLDAYAPTFAAHSAEWQRVAGLTTLTVWRLQECERHFATAAALYAARGDRDGQQAMQARHASVLVALGRIGEAGTLLDQLAASREPLCTEASLMLGSGRIWLHLERGENDAVAPAFAAYLGQLLRSTDLADWGTVPPPRQTACRGIAPLIQRWAAGALAVAGDRPLPLATFARLVLAWRAFWLGRIAEARALLRQAMGDASWGGHEVIARSHGMALEAALAVAVGDHAGAVQRVQQRVAEQPAGYGGWGLWNALLFAARVAAAAGDAAYLRECIGRMAALHDTLPEATPRRLQPVAALHGALAWLQGQPQAARRHWQEALADEAAADVMGQAGEVRVRLAALALDDGDTSAAAAWLAPLLARADDDGPRGAVFAPAELQRLARVAWDGDAAQHLGPEGPATLRRWAAQLAPTVDGACDVVAIDGAADAADDAGGAPDGVGAAERTGPEGLTRASSKSWRSSPAARATSSSRARST